MTVSEGGLFCFKADVEVPFLGPLPLFGFFEKEVNRCHDANFCH
jgi:hypothetical protein